MSTAPASPLERADRAILALECETVAGHACKVVLIGDGAPDVAALRAAIASRLEAAPALRRRLGEADGRPAWVPDPDFDLCAHVVASPARLDAEGLRREVARLFAERLDRSRPLWRIDVARLDDGGTALIWRTHHALADGTAAMRFASAVLWDEGAAPPRRRPAGRAAADDRRRHAHLMAFLRREVVPSGPSPFDGPVGRRREVAFAAIPLTPLRRAAHAACGATVNDALLAAVAGGVRRWLAARGAAAGAIGLRVPVSLHHEGDAAANRDSFFTIGVQLREPDPLARLRAVHAATRDCKEGGDAETMDGLLDGLDRAAPPLGRLAARIEDSPRRFAVAVSNVVGPAAATSVLGAPVRGLWSLAEIGRRQGLRIAAVSLGDALNLGLCADPGIVPGVAAIATGAEAEARHLIEAAT